MPTLKSDPIFEVHLPDMWNYLNGM